MFLDVGDVPNSKGIYEDPDRVYETLKEDDNLHTQLPSQDPEKNAMYHTLEDPEQTNDNSYHSPDNTKEPSIRDLYKEPGTNIPTEQEYTYAKDTEIPRASSETTDDAFYHTLENEEPASADQEYSYAKNTDIPSIPLAIHSPSSPNSDHSLEQSSLPQAPVYSTLEESNDVDNPIVSKNLNSKNLTNRTYNFFKIRTLIFLEQRTWYKRLWENIQVNESVS